VDNVVPLRRPLTRAEPERLWREAVGEQLRHSRGERGQRIADVSTRAGVSPQYLSEIERGRKDPSSEVLSAVAGALDMTVLELTSRAARRLAAPTSSPTGPVSLAA